MFLGYRYYLHFFFDPIAEDGYQVKVKVNMLEKNLGRLELLSMDRMNQMSMNSTN